MLATLVVLPGRDDFALPDLVRNAADAVFWIGVAAAIVAGLSLGRSLTATPVPTNAGTLRTSGLYHLVRHPMYTGVILMVIALAIRSESFVSLTVGAATLAFFNVKARWEERRLADRYPNYQAYAERTPRFIPGATTRRG